MTYQIRIERIEMNPDYDPNKSRMGYNYGNEPIQEPYFKTEILSSEITPEQFETVRKALIEVMK